MRGRGVNCMVQLHQISILALFTCGVVNFSISFFIFYFFFLSWLPHLWSSLFNDSICYAPQFFLSILVCWLIFFFILSYKNFELVLFLTDYLSQIFFCIDFFFSSIEMHVVKNGSIPFNQVKNKK